jgi:type II secretory pathway predicted ATPase ExeA
MKSAPNLDLLLLARQWGATAVPFSEASGSAWLDTADTQRALTLLDQTARLRSVMLLAGPNGVGKSALVGRWLSRLDRRRFCPLLLTHASLSGCGLLSALASQLAKRPAFRREVNLGLIAAAVAELDKIVPVIVLDEAQSFGYGSLEEVRLLLGLNLADPPAFGLVLIGDEYLLGTLRLRQHRSLFSRIACHLTLGPWTAPLVAQYVEQSLAAVGINRQAIEPAALNLLTSASSGLVRSLALLARAAWIAAASAGAQLIEPSHVQAAIEQVPAAASLLPPTVTPGSA